MRFFAYHAAAWAAATAIWAVFTYAAVAFVLLDPALGETGWLVWRIMVGIIGIITGFGAVCIALADREV